MDSSGTLSSPSKMITPHMLRQDLHKELLFNQKIGKNILDQKSELRKALDKRVEDQKRKEIENKKLSRRSSFEKRLEERFLKCDSKPANLISEPNHDDVPEFIKIRAKVYARNMH